jgi:methylmalonyl-CoA/ethylmalonyl-CoA epimerase
LEAFLGVRRWTEPVQDPLHEVSVQFGVDASEVRYEIVAPFGDGSPVTPVLRTARNILNHVAYRVGDIDEVLAEMRRAGAMPLGPPMPATAFGGRRIVFALLPSRMIIELIEAGA